VAVPVWGEAPRLELSRFPGSFVSFRSLASSLKPAGGVCPVLAKMAASALILRSHRVVQGDVSVCGQGAPALSGNGSAASDDGTMRHCGHWRWDCWSGGCAGGGMPLSPPARPGAGEGSTRGDASER